MNTLVSLAVLDEEVEFGGVHLFSDSWEESLAAHSLLQYEFLPRWKLHKTRKPSSRSSSSLQYCGYNSKSFVSAPLFSLIFCFGLLSNQSALLGRWLIHPFFVVVSAYPVQSMIEAAFVSLHNG
eukprot:15015.XXX_477400_477771_1 [CDS] Oithona nana genome sequencing.